MKTFISLAVLFFSNTLLSQEIQALSLTQNGPNQIKAHLKVYLPSTTTAYFFDKNINQNIITLTACYYMIGTGEVSYPETDYFVDIPDNGNYTLIVNLYTSFDETTCDYHTLEDTKTLNFTTPINGTISLATIESQNKNQNLVLFPNPTKGIFNIKTNQKIEKAKIYDISGKIIQNLFPLNSKIDVSKLEDGIYFIEILSDGKIQRKKFVLKK